MTTTTTIITDALRAAIDMISNDRQSFADCNARPDGSISDADGLILREYDDVLDKLRAALVAADHDAALLNAAQDLLAESEEYEFADGLGRGAPQQYWDALQDALEHPQPTSAQPTLTAEIVEAGTPNMFWDENPDGEGYVGNTLQEIVEIACDDLTAADGHLYVDVGCARKLPTIAVRAWIDGEGALQWEEVPDAWPWGDE